MSKIYKYINPSNNSSQNSLIYFILVILASSSYSIPIIPRGSFQVACEKNWGSFNLGSGIISGRVLACSRRLDNGEQVKSYATSAKSNTRGKKRGETGAGALFFPSSIFRWRPNFLPAPHHANAWNRLVMYKSGSSVDG